ncbi:undecaprenyldiphospho-muramoylpentapeptide beta-N-acetylglucosaminyltransferase [Polymorphospora rubra]|uniref:UDP-N-acetylglucosamine--N-acetylmuramyl-(pentapeptide) pyrophosphoryl-undecaprenol N-acetylglucosamine transferase n=1 Tax=Polymorphospora rubra TaxID=338584 RepID=A0A810MRS7_9ACTN|nr:undecaprenyldiphospho-muramoylpentapeptide beta-N-acetylglucosaminyltransferase [Polymorphospora rubra]BCJ63364.1 UDP-N-acetylglucosamine--N-acetylmuramyl-(pentapeptide) pyrophosphoryl-undecaprenol N-acetylglucosamine transferase [Polymorphospora rubra]
MGQLRSVVLAGGGTGGHIYPLLAFADCLRRHDPNVRITCVGTPKGLENELIPPAGYDLRQIPAYQLPRSINVNLMRTPDRMYKAARAAGKVIEEVRADVVVGFGGYVSVPAYLAAWRRELPIVIHEVNVPPGVANRLGMKFTKHIAVGFPHQPVQAESLRSARVVGVPLRRGITGLDRYSQQAAARAHFGLRPDLPVVFVSGGSQGARSINLAVAGAAKELARHGVQVLHVIGARNEPVSVPTDLPVPYVTLPYLSQMELGYAAADLMLCRGGAMTCAEVAAIGLPAVYVPYPHSNQEQKRNALPVVEAGGGLIVDDAELSPGWIESNLLPLVRDPRRLAAMGAAASAYGRRDGDEALLDFVYEAVA